MYCQQIELNFVYLENFTEIMIASLNENILHSFATCFVHCLEAFLSKPKYQSTIFSIAQYFAVYVVKRAIEFMLWINRNAEMLKTYKSLALLKWSESVKY